LKSNLLDNTETIINNEKIYYWVSLWEEMIENYNEKSYGLILNNPQLLLINILNEIEANQFKNKANKKYFIEQLGFFLKNDPAIINKYNSEFTHILNKLQSGEYFYLKLLCCSVQIIFHNGDYFDELYSELKSILMNDNWNENDEILIKRINQYLITELMLKGYELNDITALPRNLFDNYTTISDIVITDFPCNTKSENFIKKEKFDKENYNTAIIAEMDALSVEDRLSYFVKYFAEIKSRYYIIHQIIGIKAIDINHTIGPVKLYSPQNLQVINRSKEISGYKRITSIDIFKNDNSELFFSKDKNNLVNALIEVESININSAKSLAKITMDKLLDFINFFFSPKSILSYASNSIILNDKMKEISWNFDPYYKLDLSKWHDFLELEDISENFIACSTSIGKLLSKSKNDLLDIEIKILQAMHWYRKGCESNENEDELLNFWILIENFIKHNSKLDECCRRSNKDVSKFEIIKEILPSLEALSFSYSFGWEFQEYLVSRYANRYFDSIPLDLVDKCYLSPSAGTSINLINFLNNISDLNNYVKPKIIKDKILFAEKFFFQSEYANEYLVNQINEMKTDLILIYRLRNKIVHNAEYNDTMLAIYVQKVKKYARDLLKTLLSDYCINNKLSIDDILMQKFVESNNLLINLRVNKKKMIDIISYK
jgi:hypothetical protein